MSQPKTSKKRQRVGFGGHRTRLQLSEEELQAMKKDGYRPYWFNDEYGAIQKALAAGYVFVKPEEATSIGQSEIHQGNSDLGTKVSVIVNRTNPPTRAFLMKTLIKNYKEDEAAREAINAQVDETLRQKGGADIENQYGKVSITRS